MKKLHDFGQWILLIPNETTITLSCQEDQEAVKVLESHLAEILVGCTLELNQVLIANQEPLSIGSQPIIFPNIDTNTSIATKPNDVSLHLDQIEFDEVYKIKRRLIENRVDIHSHKVSHIPSSWTILMYGVLLLLLCCFVYKKIIPIIFTKPKKPQKTPIEEVDLSKVQLPR
ncbi:unnamed protein product [Acanthoscelides obtectus]|uniref:Uncharacterized protein n=1 Tax=Acanthoscelides obtectus TaxID=200917 RepID=A0A9P0L9A8_ACAOB|nr:unnamed protein product [Acanthoscelides obtectus]CAK1649124.1 hypothetical protein AOBTE_LOCUS16055 [Acanthoscelides obtectus]